MTECSITEIKLIEAKNKHCYEHTILKTTKTKIKDQCLTEDSIIKTDSLYIRLT